MTAVATMQKDPIALQFEGARTQITPLLPKGESLERVISTVQLAIANDPTGKLGKCTPASLFTSTCRILQWGLEIGTTAHLVPYGGVATAIADYKGLAELIVASGCARAVQAFCVYEGEPFRYVQGTEARIEHTPSRTSAGRAKLLGSYCIIKLPFSQVIFDYFPIDEIDAVRRKYSHQWKSGDCPPWWAKKYAIRQVAKTLPKSPRIRFVRAALDDDEKAELDPAMEVQAPGTAGYSHEVSSAPAPVAPAAAASTFEEEAQDDTRAVITLPKWRAHPLSEMPIDKVETSDLEALYSQLVEAQKKGDNRYTDLIGHIAVELDDRRNSH